MTGDAAAGLQDRLDAAALPRRAGATAGCRRRRRAADVPRPQPGPAGRPWRWLRRAAAARPPRHHVETFDLTRRCSPYLTYYRYGDTRQRGMALLALKHTYRRAGFEPAERELPDYLPVVLEFAALAGDRGVRLLRRAPGGPGVAAAGAARRRQPVRRRRSTRWARPCRACPARAAAGVRRLAADGPPKEDVGLEPFAPPEPPELPACRGRGGERRSSAGSLCWWVILPYAAHGRPSSSGTSGGGATTSSAGPAGRPSCRRSGCSSGAHRCSTTPRSPRSPGTSSGILIPKSLTEAIGIPERVYTLFSGSAGSLAAIGVLDRRGFLVFRRHGRPAGAGHHQPGRLPRADPARHHRACSASPHPRASGVRQRLRLPRHRRDLVPRACSPATRTCRRSRTRR